MDWITNNLQTFATLGSALTVYIALRTGAKRDANALKVEITEIKRDVKSIEQRLSRLEGAFEERGRWESQRTGTGEKR